MYATNDQLRNYNNIKANDQVIDHNDGNESIVKEIVDKRILNGKVEYRVKYTKHQWIDKQSLGFQQMIDSYEQSLRDNNEVIDENELIQTNTDYKRDSFDDRVCDDLSEVLLSYLSFEDKFGFECISKQWKSLVFNKQKKLSFNVRNKYSIATNERINYQLIIQILSKCKRIDSIDIKFEECYPIIESADASALLKFITEYCNGLKSIRYDFMDIGLGTIESFGHKFGKSLQVLENSSYGFPENSTLLSFCPKLVSIKAKNINNLFDESGQLLLITEKLENLEIVISDAIKQFQVLINKYKQILKVVSIVFRFPNITEYLNQLSNIVNLKELNIELNIGREHDISYQSLALITQKCLKLEKFTLNGNVFPIIPFKLIPNLKQLKYLSIKTDLFRDENGHELSIKSFKGLTNLIHLTFDSFGRRDDFYEDIDKYLPQLRTLKEGPYIMKTMYIMFNNVLNDKTLEHLSKLTNIRELDIGIGLSFKIQSFQDLINNCKQMKSIKLYFYDSNQCFSNNFIDALISLAVQRPEIQFKYTIRVSTSVESYWNLLMNIPDNIHINRYPCGCHMDNGCR